MPLNFPANPTEGQVYKNYYYSQSTGAWNSFSSTLNTVPSTLKNVTLTTSFASEIPLIVQGMTSQTAKLQEWKNAAGTTVAGVSPSGGIIADSLSLSIDLPVTDGGTGASSFTSGAYLKGSGSDPLIAQTGIPAGDITSGILGISRGGTAATSRSSAGLVPVVTSSSERDILYPTPTQGDSVWRSDKGYTERYRGVYNSSTNKGGMVVAGWYPDSPITARFWIPDHTANPTGSFGVSLDSARSSTLSSNLFSISGATVTLRNPGVYSMWFRIRSSAVATGTRAFFGIQMSDLFINGTSTLIDAGFRTSIENSYEDSDHVSATYTALSTNVTATFSTYSSVSASYTAGVAAITYLGPVA